MASFFSGIGTQGPKKVLKKNKKGYDKGNESDSKYFTSQVLSSSS